MNSLGRTNICSKSIKETPEQTEICSKFHGIRKALEHIRISQLVLRVQIGTLNMYFQTGLQFEVIYEFICKSNIYIFHILFSFIKIVQLELFVGSFKYTANIYLLKLNNRHARTRFGMYSALVIKTLESSFHECFYLYDTGL